MAPGDGDRPSATDDTQGPLGRVVPGEDPSERGERYLNALLNRLDPSDGAAVEQQAGQLYRQACERNLLTGRGAEPVAAACVYIACRTIGATVRIDPTGSEAGTPKTARGVSDGPLRRPAGIEPITAAAPPVGGGTPVHPQLLRQVVDGLTDEFGLGLPPRDAADYLTGLLARFDVPPTTAQRAHELLRQAQDADMGTTAGRHPEPLAAASLVVAFDHGPGDIERPFDLADVAGAIDPSAATLRERRAELRELLGDS